MRPFEDFDKILLWRYVSQTARICPLIPKSFEYYAPATIDEAVSFLERFGQDAKILAGGQSLIPIMKLRLASPKYVLDINRIPDLEYVLEKDGSILIGARTRHHEIERSQLLKEKLGMMTETASQIGDPQVRNNGTIGGSLAHADPAGDWGATMIALRGTLHASSSKGKRMIKAEEFFVDTLTSSLKPNEILTEIQIPLNKGDREDPTPNLSVKLEISQPSVLRRKLR